MSGSQVYAAGRGRTMGRTLLPAGVNPPWPPLASVPTRDRLGRQSQRRRRLGRSWPRLWWYPEAVPWERRLISDAEWFAAHVTPVLARAGLRLDPHHREVYRGDRYVALSRKKFGRGEVDQASVVDDPGLVQATVAEALARGTARPSWSAMGRSRAARATRSRWWGATAPVSRIHRRSSRLIVFSLRCPVSGTRRADLAGPPASPGPWSGSQRVDVVSCGSAGR